MVDVFIPRNLTCLLRLKRLTDRQCHGGSFGWVWHGKADRKPYIYTPSGSGCGCANCAADKHGSVKGTELFLR